MSRPDANALLADIRVALAPLRANAEVLIADFTARWRSSGDDHLSVETLMGACTTWWSHLLAGDRVSAACCQLALGFISLSTARINDAQQLSHLCSPLVTTETDPGARSLLAATHHRLQNRISIAIREQQRLLEPANHALDRGSFDEAIALYDRACQEYPASGLPAYERARAGLLAGLIDGDEYLRHMRLILRNNPFFEQAMPQAPAGHASAFRARLRGWTHREDAGVLELADFAAGALDARLGWQSAMAYIVLGHLDDALSEPLPQALRVAGVPQELIQRSPLGERAVRMQRLLHPAREHFRATMRALDCALAAPPPFDEPSPRVSRGRRLEAMSEAARLVARSADALVAGDLPTADELAADALNLDGPNPLERAHALEVRARARVAVMVLQEACNLFQECRHNQVLAGAMVREQARVATDLASTLLRIGNAVEARRVVSQAIDLLCFIGEPEPRRMIMAKYIYASSLVALGDPNGAFASFREAESSRSSLVAGQLVSADLTGSGGEVAQRLADDLRYRATATYAELVNAVGTTEEVIQVLRLWLQTADETRRSKSERDLIAQRFAGVLARAGRTAEAEKLVSDLAIDDPWLEARLAVSNGQLDRAADLLQTFLDLSDETGPADAESQIKVLLALAQLSTRLGSERAVDLLDRAVGIGYRHILDLGAADEREWRRATALVSVAVGQLVDRAGATGARQTVLRAAESVLNIKTLGSALQSLLSTTKDRSSSRETRQHLASQLSALALRGPTAIPDDSIADMIHSIQGQYWQTQRLDRLPDAARPRWTAIEEIADRLAAGSAFVDIGLCLPPRDDVFIDNADDRGVGVYAASVVTSDGLVDWQVLGPETSFDQFLSSFLFQSRSVAELGAIPVLASAFAGQAAQLCRDIWEQTIGRLALPDDISTIYLCCDGVFSTLPIECGLMPGGQYAVEKFLFIHVLGASELAFDSMPLARRRSDDNRHEAILVGAPDFGEHHQTNHSTSSWRYPLRDELDDFRWECLDGARAEIQVIQKHYAQGARQTLVGPEATKSALAAVSAPRILHLATHAFFLNGTTMATRDASEGVASRVDTLPALRCGLVLCAANSRRTLSWKLPDDGIMTALELSEVDLQHTELVVLSGCETARGGARIRETVNGLALACHLAGSRTVIASRWRVPDLASSLLFDFFYQDLVHEHTTPESALRNSMIRAIKAARTQSRSEFAFPYSWGAWSLSVSGPRSSQPSVAPDS